MTVSIMLSSIAPRVKMIRMRRVVAWWGVVRGSERRGKCTINGVLGRSHPPCVVSMSSVRYASASSPGADDVDSAAGIVKDSHAAALPPRTYRRSLVIIVAMYGMERATSYDQQTIQFLKVPPISATSANSSTGRSLRKLMYDGP